MEEYNFNYMYLVPDSHGNIERLNSINDFLQFNSNSNKWIAIEYVLHELQIPFNKWLGNIEIENVTDMDCEVCCKEYIYGKKKLREIDKRVRWLQKRLDNLTVVEQKPENQDKIFFGAYVRLRNNDHKEEIYQIVGPDDLDIEKNMITLASPVGRALKGREKGDDIKIKLPEGNRKLKVLEISYDPLE